MNTKSLTLRCLVVAVTALVIFTFSIEAQRVRVSEGTRPDQMADLVVVSMTPSISFPAPKEMVDIAVEVRNQATHAENNIVLALFAGTERFAEKTFSLQSSETTIVHVSWKPTLEGKVTLTAQIDPDFKLTELDQHNNLLSTDLIVANQPSNEVDLAILGIESLQMPDKSMVLRARIRNDGKTAVHVPLVARYDKQIADVRLVDIAADATVNVEIPWADTQPPMQLSAEINPRYRSSEKQAANNVFVKDFRPAVDLRIEGLSVSATQFERSRPRQVTISFRVVNAGASAINKTFRTSVFPGVVVRSNNAQPFVAHNVTTAGLPIGGVVYVSHTFVSPVGEFDIRVEADADNSIAEADESNNIAVSNFKNPTPDVGRWVSIGPTRIIDGGLGAIGRIHSIAVRPTMPSTMYVGGPNCGIWKTTDGGTSWAPVGDSLPTLSLAALAIDPVTPTRIYAVLGGTGIFRSDDAAASWTQISNDPGTPLGAGVMLIDPTTPSRMYLTAGSNGLYRSIDSGVNWTRVKTGFVNDLIMDPSDPSTLYAGVQSDGVYKTTTGGAAGDTAWTKLAGLPTDGFTRVTLAISAPDRKTIYAGLSGSPFRVFRSTDGAAFSLRFTDTGSIYNPWIGVDPAVPSIVYLLSNNFRRSTDGGASFPVVSGDTHECQKFAVDPVTPGVIYLGRDNGLFRSSDRGLTFAQIGGGIPNVEIYDGALAATDPKIMIIGTQDNGTIKYDGSNSVWNEFRGGDGATVAFDPTNSQILYSMGQYASSIARSTNGGASSNPFAAGLPSDTDCFNLQYFVHPTTPTTLLASCTSLWRITSLGGTWTPIFTPATNSIVRAAVDPSVDLYYAGARDGKLYAGPGGASFQQVFTHPRSAGFRDIRVSPDDPSIIYAAFGGGGTGRVYRMSRSSPAPTGVSANDVTANLPIGLTVKTLAIDRMTPFTIYAGTNQGVYRGRSTDNGSTWSWTSFNNGMPAPDIRDLEVHPVTGVMRAATYGRSAYEVNTDFPVGSLLAAEGKVTGLRVHDVGTGYGPPLDFIDVEVVITLDSQPGKAFGFQLRPDANRDEHRDMLNLLRDAFKRERRIRIDYFRTGVRNGRIIRVVQIP